MKRCRAIRVARDRAVYAASTHRDGHGLFAINVTRRGRGDHDRG